MIDATRTFDRCGGHEYVAPRFSLPEESSSSSTRFWYRSREPGITIIVTQVPSIKLLLLFVTFYDESFPPNRRFLYRAFSVV